MISISGTGSPAENVFGFTGALIWVVPLILAAMIGLFTLDGGLVLDDRGMIRGNPFITTEVPYSDAFRRDFLGRQLDHHPTVWRPLMPMVWKLIWGVAPNNPLPFRLLSMLLHMTATGAMIMAGRKLVRNEKVLWSATCLFAVHPVHAETIGSIVSQADVLSAILGMAAINVVLRESAFKVRDGCLTAMLLVTACLVKESAVVYGAACITASLAIPSRPGNDRAYRILPALLVVVAICMFQVSLKRDPLLTSWHNNIGFDAHGTTRILLGLHIVGKAATMCFVPVGLAANHGYGAVDLETTTLLPFAIPGFMYLLTAGLGLLWALKNHKVDWVVGVCILFGPILLQSNLLITVTTDLAERLLYTSSVASSVMLAALVFRLVSNRLAYLAAIILLVLVYTGQSWKVQRPWRDSLSALRYSLSVEPLSWRTHYFYGREIMKTGNVAEGAWHIVISRYIRTQYPKQVDLSLLGKFVSIPADKRSIEAPAVLFPDDPCGFAVQVITDLQDANVWISKEFIYLYIQRYEGCGVDTTARRVQ